jgi:general nucleoside transport system permease protein
MMDTVMFIVLGTLGATTPLLFAALGEMVAERSGVLNLSIEGMMATGAAVAFAVATLSHSHAFGFLAGSLAAAALSLVFGLLVLVFLANQVAAGLAIGLLGLGVSALVGKPFEGNTIAALGKLDILGLAHVPIIGPILFGQDVVVYAGVALIPTMAWVFRRTKLGLIIRAVGEAPMTARDIGYSVIGIRFGCIAFGGLLAGIGGAYLAIAYTALWAEGLVAGRGWIAVALVVFGSWAPLRIAVGAYVFGAISLLELSIQGLGFYIPSQFLSASPYIVTIVVLAIISRDATYLRLSRPLALGKVFRNDG